MGGDAGAFFNISANRPTSTFTGSIATNKLTVTVAPASPPIKFEADMEITGGATAANTVIVSQDSGTPGGIGIYTLNNSSTVASTTLHVTFKAYTSQGFAVEAFADGTKHSVFSTSETGAAFFGRMTGSGIGILISPTADGDMTRRAYQLTNAANSHEYFSVDMQGDISIDVGTDNVGEAQLTIKNLGTLGASIKLIDASVTPNKYMRSVGGVWQLINSADNLALLSMTDAGAAQFIGTISTAAPAGSSAGVWKLGAAAVVSPTSPNRTIAIDIGGSVYYLAAKTTNN